MFSVFSKTLVEAKAADILRNYSDVTRPSTFGDAQAIYSDLVDHFDGGAQARVSAQALESKLTTVRLNRSWTKTVRAFVNMVTTLIRDHKEATEGKHDDEYYIEKLNATFSEHKDMSSHIQNIFCRVSAASCASTKLNTTISFGTLATSNVHPL